MAHQWFGDMVTMQWWNNLWLNEGFATWMENKPVAAWHPEWNVPAQEAVALDSTLNLDSQAVTRTIRAEANTPDEINEMFDGITYQKGGAVLGMVESYLGEEQFRKGVHNYLEAHLFGNATAEDFWSAQTQASGKPVDKIMASFIDQPGVPLLGFAEPSAGAVSVSQGRFYLSPAAQRQHAADPTQIWTVPVCLKGSSTADCPLLATAQGSVPVADGSVFFANARAKGYYRSVYPAAVQQQLAGSVETLSAPERVDLLGDTWAAIRSGHATIAASLVLAEATRNDASSDVLRTVQTQLQSIDARLLTTPAERAQFQAWVRRTWKPALDAAGLPHTGETPETAARRDVLFSIVGSLGEDPATIAEARKLAEQDLADPNAADPNLGPIALRVAAENGDGKLFAQLQHVFENSDNPQRAEQALSLLGDFTDPALTDRAMEFATSGKVKNQDSVILLSRTLANPSTHDAAWAYIRTHWPAVSGQLTEMNGGRIVGAASSFCSVEKESEVKDFYGSHAVHASARTLNRTEAQIADCVEFRSAQESNLRSWLAARAQ